MTFAVRPFQPPVPRGDGKDVLRLGNAIAEHLRSLEDKEALIPHVQGTWTPVLTFATAGNQSIAYTTRLGYYTKIGHWVSAEFVIVTSTFTHTTAAGNLQITGLPFTAKNDAGMVWHGSVNWQGMTKANYTALVCSVSANTSLLTLTASGSGQSTVNTTTADWPTAGSVILRGSVTYRI